MLHLNLPYQTVGRPVNKSSRRTIQAQITDDTFRKLFEITQQERASMSAVIRYALEKFLARYYSVL